MISKISGAQISNSNLGAQETHNSPNFSGKAIFRCKNFKKQSDFIKFCSDFCSSMMYLQGKKVTGSGSAKGNVAKFVAEWQDKSFDKRFMTICKNFAQRNDFRLKIKRTP